MAKKKKAVRKTRKKKTAKTPDVPTPKKATRKKASTKQATRRKAERQVRGDPKKKRAKQADREAYYELLLSVQERCTKLGLVFVQEMTGLAENWMKEHA